MEVHNYPNYLIYPDGRVWSNYGGGRFLKERFTKDYQSVSLSKNNKPEHIYLHRLLAQHYIPNPNNLPYVDHIDRNKLNNNIDNLRWVTRSENGLNVSKRKSNKSGHKNIAYCNTHHRWSYKKVINKIKKEKSFKTLTDALCYKFIYILISKYI
tara:strand:- start:101 stop:562 length:462 start_codon:yes stop_codon:yes gene_type:complete